METQTFQADHQEWWKEWLLVFASCRTEIHMIFLFRTKHHDLEWLSVLKYCSFSLYVIILRWVLLLYVQWTDCYPSSSIQCPDRFVSMASITIFHKLGGLKEHTFILCHFWRVTVLNQPVTSSLWRLQGHMLPCPFLASCGSQQFLTFLGLYSHLWLHHYMLSSPCVWLCVLSFPLQGHQ